MDSPRSIDGPYFDNFDDLFSTFYLDFTDGLRLIFGPYPRPVPPPRLSYVQLCFGVTAEELVCYNIKGKDRGSPLTLIPHDSVHRKDLGLHWKLACEYLKPRPFDNSERLRAWSYVQGSLIYAEALMRPARSGIF